MAGRQVYMCHSPAYCRNMSMGASRHLSCPPPSILYKLQELSAGKLMSSNLARRRYCMRSNLLQPLPVALPLLVAALACSLFWGRVRQRVAPPPPTSQKCCSLPPEHVVAVNSNDCRAGGTGQDKLQGLVCAHQGFLLKLAAYLLSDRCQILLYKLEARLRRR